MEQAKNGLGALNLTAEIEIRRAIGEKFDSLLEVLKGGLTAQSAEDLDALAQLLLEVIEVRKRAEAEEKALKDELRRHFGESDVLTLASCVCLRDRRSRSSLDKEQMIADLGAALVGKYEKRTEYEVLSVKRVK